MRLDLTVVSSGIEYIPNLLRKMAKEIEEHMADSNCSHYLPEGNYTYHFVDSEDLYEDVSNMELVNPYGEYDEDERENDSC